VTDESKERSRAKREYLIAGALAMAAAVIGIAFESGGLDGSGRRGELLVVGALAAVMYGRVAYGLLRRRGDDEGAPSAERMNRMAVIWYLLAGVLGAAVLRAPFGAFRSYGADGLVPREWLAGALGLAIVVSAAGRAVVSFVARRGRGEGKGAT
jgi:hypothetical protein